jgi:L-asparaginase II
MNKLPLNHAPLIELRRNDTLECLHLGSAVLADAQGEVLAHVGDPHWMCFTRSTLKALQALPAMEAGVNERLGWAQPELALLCASHNGEDRHVERVQHMLDTLGMERTRLQCGCHLPLRFTYTDTPVPPGLTYDERHNNCSGKHGGFLAWCQLQGVDDSGYLQPSHPLQQHIRQAVAEVAGLPADALVAGTDGCSAPNYAMPLSALARCYAKLAGGASNERWAPALDALAQAMVAHPELVSGEGRNDEAFMRAGRGDWVTKVGADGVQVVASRSRQQALALKVLDGNRPALFAATVEALDQLGWLDDAQRAELAPWRAQRLLNARGTEVGERLPVFRIA